MMKGLKVKVAKRLSLQIKKNCGCGIAYTSLPTGTVEAGGMYWFNCMCHSTLVVKVK